MKAKKLSKKAIFLIVVAAIMGVALIVCLGLEIAFRVADGIRCWHPDYEMTDISGILDKETLTDSDYDILYKQTGLTRLGVDRMLERGTAGKLRIGQIQTDFFTEYKVTNGYYAPFVCTDYINRNIATAYLKDGDIIVTTSTHFSGWRMGHAGLVTNAKAGRILQANAVGMLSDFGTIRDFNNRVNFMILSPKVDEDTKRQVCEYAEQNLTGKIYDFTTGVFTDKNKVERTQCAHIVWSAYKKFGIDLDSNGGLVVTPKNIANSPYVEVVQVFGMDPIKLWK